MQHGQENHRTELIPPLDTRAHQWGVNHKLYLLELRNVLAIFALTYLSRARRPLWVGVEVPSSILAKEVEVSEYAYFCQTVGEE